MERLCVQQRLYVSPAGTHVYEGTWRLKEDEGSTESPSTTKKVAIKILPLPDRSSSKPDEGRVLMRKREASVLRRLAALEVPFLVEVEAIFNVHNLPAVTKEHEGLPPDSAAAAASGDDDLSSAKGPPPSSHPPLGVGEEQRPGKAIVMVMAFYEQSLFDYLAEQRTASKDQGLGLRDALVLLKQMATVISHCHQHSICHRDVKLENFMWSKQKREIRLIDFGSSGIIRAGKLFAHPCGSLAYLAPELVQGKGYSENVDVWALGVTFYALLTGRFPFGGGSKTADRPLNVLQRIACQCLYIPDHLPAEVKDLLKCMLCRSRKRRISAEGILAHSALGSVPISMSDLDQMERELRRQEKEKIDSEEESRLNYYNNSGPITRNLQQ